jgi:cytochrome P450
MDTLSLTLQWAIAILCHFPKVQEKISAEINGFIRTHQRLPNFKDRNEVPYCISVMKECIRYRSISPFGLPHAVRQDGK